VEQDLSTFINPDGYWEYQGPFSVEVTPGAKRDHVPCTVRFEGNIAYIDAGRIKQTIGGIQLYAFETPFYWGNNMIRAIRDKDGRPIWVNRNYSEMG